MKLYVKTLTGKTITIWARPHWHIYGVTVLLQSLEGMPADDQRLIFGGRQLEVRRTLRDYNIKSGATVHLVMKLLGD